MPEVAKQVPLLKDEFNWKFALSEQPEKITDVDPELIDEYLEEDAPGVFDIEQRRISRQGKANVAELEDSEAKKQRLRALIDMMNGVLEIKDDIFATDVPKPKFMFGDEDGDGKIPESDWDDEQKKMAKNYEKKVQFLEETRVKTKQQLLSEAKKLVETDSTSGNSFDANLQQLCKAKCDSDAEQHSILLRSNRLKLVDEQYKMVKAEFEKIDNIRSNFVEWDATFLKSDLDNSLNRFRTSLEQVMIDEKANEKLYKKEILADAQIQDGPVDELNRIYKAHRLTEEVRIADFGLEIANKQPVEILQHIIDKLLANPPNVTPKVPENWSADPEAKEAFVTYCETKYENDVRRKVLDLMSTTCQNQADRLEKERTINQKQKLSLDTELENIENNMKTNYMDNLPVQLLLREGLCQLDGVDMTSGREYNQCTLVEKHEIEALNERILEIGKQKLDEMKKSIQFTQQIRLNQWELQRLTMRKEDLQETIRHIQLFKLSKNVQAQIEGSGGDPAVGGGTGPGGLDKQKAITTQISKLEKRLAVQQKMQENQAKQLKKKCNIIRIEAESKSIENEDLSEILSQLVHTVAEKRILDEASRDRQGQQAKKKMQMIVKRRRLVEMARAQAQDLSMLHNELERMRMRTFPALTSLQNK